ncbi:3'(2'),5'-bisphosphate nucleotidase [Hibiscus syriacus]|uniref:3'(2'),5'-bisphosphate nucleotidase n=1 Tax=Hibiscus syriacus TaxID=106335 RepID=A0A6A3C219_HIBSY|nr:3'(2'),5'-bisphosphate nucleotidase [Hibiscus syriacus]
MEPLHRKNKPISWLKSAIPVRVSSVDNPALATFCEPVEKSNSSHSFTAGLAHSVGLRKEPLRVYSMVKYAAIARGDAEIFMKFARTGYKEKIWDHAAGVIIIEKAGGVVTDAGGSRLDFSKGMFLEDLDRGIIACCGAKLHERIVGAVDASWNSSSL